MDWKDQLSGLLGTLPEGEELTQEPAADDTPRQKAPLDVILDRKGRKGKEATIIAGFTIPDDQVADIARQMKGRLGCGGSSRGGEILLQGDKRAQAADFLSSLGLKSRMI